MSIFDVALHIPAERTWRVSAGRQERVLLPLEAQPGLAFFIAAAAVTFVAAACLAMSAVALAGARHGDNVVIAVIFALAAITPAAIALTAVADVSRAPPLLTIDGNGIEDRRLRDGHIGWDEVAAAEIITAGSGIQAVKLSLKTPRRPHFNPCRIGALSAAWSERRGTRIVALLLLNHRPHVLAHTIVALAARHGAAVDAPVSRHAVF